MASISYSCTHPFQQNPSGQHGHLVNRPWVEVNASWAATSHRVWCLVDTGADEPILDRGTAAVLGINIASLPQVSVVGIGSGAGNAVSFGRQTGVRLDFGGTSVTIDVLFGAVAIPILGRTALLLPSQGLDVGFQANVWHHT